MLSDSPPERDLPWSASGIEGCARFVQRLWRLFDSYDATATGEDKALRRWAIEAARADPSNHDAAMMMWKLVNELTDDRVKQGTATINFTDTVGALMV